MKILAQSIFLALALASIASGQEVSISPRQDMPAIQPRMQEEHPQIQGDESTLVLPRLLGPRMPAPPPPIESPKIPSVFQGCWQGDPGEFDWVNTDAGIVAIGAPGKITFCYSDSEISVPEADVRISPGAHALDWLLHLGLGFSTFSARGIATDVSAITPTRMRGRTDLVVIHNDHWLYVIPTHGGDPSQVDWKATVRSDGILVEAQQIIAASGLRMWGGWHAVFHRVPDQHGS